MNEFPQLLQKPARSSFLFKVMKKLPNQGQWHQREKKEKNCYYYKQYLINNARLEKPHQNK